MHHNLCSKNIKILSLLVIVFMNKREITRLFEKGGLTYVSRKIIACSAVIDSRRRSLRNYTVTCTQWLARCLVSLQKTADKDVDYIDAPNWHTRISSPLR